MFLNHVPGWPPALPIFLVSSIKHTFISSLAETERPVMGVTDKGDIQGMQCWWSSRNVVEKHCFKGFSHLNLFSWNVQKASSDISCIKSTADMNLKTPGFIVFPLNSSCFDTLTVDSIDLTFISHIKPLFWCRTQTLLSKSFWAWCVQVSPLVYQEMRWLCVCMCVCVCVWGTVRCCSRRVMCGCGD